MPPVRPFHADDLINEVYAADPPSRSAKPGEEQLAGLIR
jgi:hypothetical protein